MHVQTHLGIGQLGWDSVVVIVGSGVVGAIGGKT